MKLADFAEMKFLSPDTLTSYGDLAFGNYEKITKGFVRKVDRFIEYMLANGAGTFKIHDFNTHQHDGKDHREGMAVDMDFTGIPLGNQVILALLYGWWKVGFYPYWNTPGLHLSLVYTTPPLVWYGFYEEKDGKQIQRYVYSSKFPDDVARRIAGNGGVK